MRKSLEQNWIFKEREREKALRSAVAAEIVCAPIDRLGVFALSGRPRRHRRGQLLSGLRRAWCLSFDSIIHEAAVAVAATAYTVACGSHARSCSLSRLACLLARRISWLRGLIMHQLMLGNRETWLRLLSTCDQCETALAEFSLQIFSMNINQKFIHHQHFLFSCIFFFFFSYLKHSYVYSFYWHMLVQLFSILLTHSIFIYLFFLSYQLNRKLFFLIFMNDLLKKCY